MKILVFVRIEIKITAYLTMTAPSSHPLADPNRSTISPLKFPISRMRPSKFLKIIARNQLITPNSKIASDNPKTMQIEY
jgi:hypothetical protein